MRFGLALLLVYDAVVTASPLHEEAPYYTGEMHHMYEDNYAHHGAVFPEFVGYA